MKVREWIAGLGRSRRASELAGLAAIVLGILALLALLSFDGRDASLFHDAADGAGSRNWFGPVGASVAEALVQLFGVAAFLLPLPLVVVGWRRFRDPRAPISPSRSLGVAGLALATCALLDLLFGAIRYGGQVYPGAGGYVGDRLAGLLRSAFSSFGATFVALGAVVAMLVVVSRDSLVRSLVLLGRAAADRLRPAIAALRRTLDFRTVRAAWRRQARSSPSAAPAPDAPSAPGVTIPLPAERVEPGGPAPRTIAPQAPEARPAITRDPRVETPTPKRAAAERAGRAGQALLPMEHGSRGFALPPLDLLNPAEEQSRESERALLERAQMITDKFREFAIEGQVVAIHPGPVVTTFEFKPEAGVKYSKITGMTDDLSLALRAESVRIDRMAGRATVGIEVPNVHQEVIYPRELIASKPYAASHSKLTLALGKDIHGEVAIAQLDRMPHLLIAGATGAGKSVGLNGMIVSMLYKSTPEDLRFIMIDTKMIELGIYADIPHLLIPVVTDPKHASAALKWAVREMELRYHMLASVGVRNIAQFNDLLREEPGRTMDDPRSGTEVPLAHLPYIVIVIDEMADLMMVSSADVEESVMRLAQMARAVGIHLILATQRPSVDVITGTIKANFPSRIAFRVSQRVDSRTIIDQQGAEHLLGRGDMLFLSTGTSRVRRLHSGFITEAEINRITEYLKRMAAPRYDESVLDDAVEGARSGADGGERDEMFPDAVRTVITEGRCSITLIQRRLQLGYARAARIVDMMESAGVVSPGEGSKPRDVLVGPEYLETLEARR